MKTTQSRATGKQSAAETPHGKVTEEATPAPIRFGKVENPLRILVADDNEVNLELVIELLKKRGHSVAGARDGQEAIDALAKDHFDVVLMDEQMPGMDGLEATRAIRQAEKTSGRHQMIVGVTGNVGQDEQKRRADAGMDAFLAKPYDMNALFEKVETISRGTDPATPAQVSSAPATPDSDEDVATHLQRTTGGNDKLIRSLAKSFLADTPKRLAGIRRALAKKDPETLARTAHALKGSLGIFGAQKAVAAARSLEAMGRASNLRGAQKEFRALETEFSRLKRDLLALQSATKKPRAASRPRRKK